MNEAERVRLLNDLCDFRDDLQGIHYPPQTKHIDILTRAVAYVKGTSAKWLREDDSMIALDRNGIPFVFPTQCSSCLFGWGRSDFKICPNCGAKMKR